MKKLIVLLGLLLLMTCYPYYNRSVYYSPKVYVDDCQECYSDFDCPIGQRCFKSGYNLTGCCGEPVDEYGVPQYIPLSPSGRRVSGCSFDTDCPIGFKCVKQPWRLKGVCIKR